MSVHYHAYQSRGYLFTAHEALCQQWRERFSHYDPHRIASILNLSYDSEYLYLRYFQSSYRLRLADGALEKQQKNDWSEDLFFNESMSLYHLLFYTCEHPRFAGVWIPDTSLNLAATHRNTPPDPLLPPFAKKFTGKAELLASACARLGGMPISKGDAGFEFHAFPQVPLRLIFWDAEEDLPAQIQILFDKYATDYIHFETSGCILSDLLEKLEAASLIFLSHNK